MRAGHSHPHVHNTLGLDRRPAVDIVDIDAANHTQPSTLLSSEDIVHEDHPADVHIPLLDVNAVREHNRSVSDDAPLSARPARQIEPWLHGLQHQQSGSVTAREMGMTRARPGRIVRVSARRPKVFKSWAKFKKLHEADRENNINPLYMSSLCIYDDPWTREMRERKEAKRRFVGKRDFTVTPHHAAVAKRTCNASNLRDGEESICS